MTHYATVSLCMPLYRDWTTDKSCIKLCNIYAVKPALNWNQATREMSR